MELILKVEHLEKVFRRRDGHAFAAVHDVSFELFRGECLGIIGESGSGKSTLVNMIARLIEPTGGRIILDGEDITEYRGRALKEVYRRIQMVFQTPAESFDPRRPLGDGIGESLRNYGITRAEAKKEVERLLKLCGLSAEFAGKYPHQVSGGQCQRAAIARAIALKPEILICDEATSALDVTIQREIIDLLSELKQKSGMSYLFICHDLALVREFCDRMIVMRRGD